MWGIRPPPEFLPHLLLQEKLQQLLREADEANKAAQEELVSTKQAAIEAQAEFAAKLESHTGASVSGGLSACGGILKFVFAAKLERHMGDLLVGAICRGGPLCDATCQWPSFEREFDQTLVVMRIAANAMAKLQVQRAVEQNNKQAQKALDDAKKKNAAEMKKVRCNK
eukprot:1157877-Pelagomonas_calceolata.AAC.12